MTITSKFNINDNAWFKWDDEQWYLCTILDVHFTAFISDVTGKEIKDLYYKVCFREVTGIPPSTNGDRYWYIEENKLYKNKGGD